MKEGLIKHNSRWLGEWSSRKIEWLSKLRENNKSFKKRELNYRQTKEKLWRKFNIKDNKNREFYSKWLREYNKKNRELKRWLEKKKNKKQFSERMRKEYRRKNKITKKE